MTLLESLKQDCLRMLEILGILRERQQKVPPNLPISNPPIPTVVPTKPKLTSGVDLKGHSPAWCGGTRGERLKMYALAKELCKEEKLSAQMTLDLLATIHGESGFNQWCINQQSLDYGVAQFSARYYLKEYKMTPQEAIDNPEKCIRIMCKNFKAGRQSNWVAYKTRSLTALKQYA